MVPHITSHHITCGAESNGPLFGGVRTAVLRVLLLFAITQQPSGVMGTYTYLRVVGNKEETLKTVLDLIYGFKCGKMENVPNIGHLELIQWWYLYPVFFTVDMMHLCNISKILIPKFNFENVAILV
jgi:hypothetical protein